MKRWFIVCKILGLESYMIYIFYTMLVLIGVFFIVEVVNLIKGREWGENP